MPREQLISQAMGICVRIRPGNGHGFSAERFSRLHQARARFRREQAAFLERLGRSPERAAQEAEWASGPVALGHDLDWARGWAPQAEYATQNAALGDAPGHPWVTGVTLVIPDTGHGMCIYSGASVDRKRRMPDDCEPRTEPEALRRPEARADREEGEE